MKNSMEYDMMKQDIRQADIQKKEADREEACMAEWLSLLHRLFVCANEQDIHEKE